MDTENKALIEWLLANITKLRSSNAKWTLTLHGGQDGRIVHEINTTGELLPSKRQEHRQVLEERRRV